jgi:protein-L-isoaspartate(D-aspartate) O-methyltransferase
MDGRADIDEIRAFYARLMAVASGSSDPRLERAFETVPREAFVPPGPWQVVFKSRYIETPSADPSYLYQDLLIALDAKKRINNGEPSLHAAWLGAIAPQSGEAVTHIGAGTGYYTAILSMLVLPTGQVSAFEIDGSLAEKARRNLEPFEAVTVINRDATRDVLPASDVIYVNAGVSAPPANWLRALNLGGRMIFPWRPNRQIGFTLLVLRETNGFSVTPAMQSWFIPCIGASDEIMPIKVPDSLTEARSIQSVWLTGDRGPDDSAVAIYPDIWFSSEPVVAIH